MYPLLGCRNHLAGEEAEPHPQHRHGSHSPPLLLPSTGGAHGIELNLNLPLQPKKHALPCQRDHRSPQCYASPPRAVETRRDAPILLSLTATQGMSCCMPPAQPTHSIAMLCASRPRPRDRPRSRQARQRHRATVLHGGRSVDTGPLPTDERKTANDGRSNHPKHSMPWHRMASLE